MRDAWLSLDSVQDFREGRAEAPQLFKMNGGQFRKALVCRGGQPEQDAAAVMRVGAAFDEPAFGQSVDQFDGAVVADAQAIREVSDSRRALAREPLYRQQGLMLARGQFGGDRRRLAERKKTPDQIAEIGECLVGLMIEWQSSLPRMSVPCRRQICHRFS
jgi:hypothetical protein